MITTFCIYACLDTLGASQIWLSTEKKIMLDLVFSRIILCPEHWATQSTLGKPERSDGDAVQTFDLHVSRKPRIQIIRSFATTYLVMHVSTIAK